MAGARPRTLPASLVPVAVGTAAAAGHVDGGLVAWRAVAAGIVALALQVGTNYANDYSDGIRGTDDGRVGPTRLVASGQATASSVRKAAFISFSVAAVVGLVLSLAAGPELLLVGVACIAAGWFYTGGGRPYGYMGLGEVFVFVFFGLVATVGSAYVQAESLVPDSIWAAVGVGALATALLVTNNLRDIDSDRAAGKMTLSVRIGDRWSRRFFVSLCVLALVALVPASSDRSWVLLGLGSVPVMVDPVRAMLGGVTGPDLVPVLGATSRAQLVYGALVTAGFAISA